ncbi:MAG: hypothetical protein MJH10_18285, partial [Epibacterium sp.]|nr:hypothetical protein [Epibacterium sp.]
PGPFPTAECDKTQPFLSAAIETVFGHCRFPIAAIGTVAEKGRFVRSAVLLVSRASCLLSPNSKVPLGFISLTENLMMVGMAVWMLAKL